MTVTIILNFNLMKQIRKNYNLLISNKVTNNRLEKYIKMADADPLMQKYLNFRKNHTRKQLALKSLNNYISQLKIHYDLNEKDITKILKYILKIKNKDIFINNLWNIFK